MDLQASAELGGLLSEALDLPVLLPEKFVELLLRDDDGVVLVLGGEEDRWVPSAHRPSGRGLTTSRIYNLGTRGTGNHFNRRRDSNREVAEHVRRIYDTASRRRQRSIAREICHSLGPAPNRPILWGPYLPGAPASQEDKDRRQGQNSNDAGPDEDDGELGRGR